MDQMLNFFLDGVWYQMGLIRLKRQQRSWLMNGLASVNIVISLGHAWILFSKWGMFPTISWVWCSKCTKCRGVKGLNVWRNIIIYLMIDGFPQICCCLEPFLSISFNDYWRLVVSWFLSHNNWMGIVFDDNFRNYGG